MCSLNHQVKSSRKHNALTSILGYVILCIFCFSTVSLFAQDTAKEPAKITVIDKKASAEPKKESSEPKKESSEPKKESEQPAAPKEPVKLAINPNDIIIPPNFKEVYSDKGEIAKILEFRHPMKFRFASPQSLEKMDGKQYKELVEALAADEILYVMALKESFIDKDEALKNQAKALPNRILSYLYYKKHIIPNAGAPSDTAIKEYYDKNKKNYYQPLEFKMRHIFLSTYIPYIAKEGDTLESIAATVSGDKSTIKYILSDKTKEPRWVAPEERESKLFKPVEPGEMLLVQMPKDQAAKVREKAEEVLNECKKGGDFVSLAEKYSQTEQKGTLIGPVVPDREQKPILPEIIDAIKKTPAGGISDIVQTKHGFQIYKIEEKNDVSTKTLEEVKKQIIDALGKQTEASSIQKTLSDLWSKYQDKFQINTAVLLSDTAKPDDVVLKAEDFEVKLSDISRANPEYKSEIKNPENIPTFLSRFRPVSDYLLAREARSLGLDKTEDFTFISRQVSIGMINTPYLRGLIDRNIKISDEEMSAGYEKDKETYKIPEQVELYLIAKKISDNIETMKTEERDAKIKEITEKLAALTKNVKDINEFKELARKESDDDQSKEKGGYVGPVPYNYRGGFNGKLQGLAVGEMSEPVPFGNFVYVLRCEGKKEASYRPFSEVKDTVERRLKMSKAKDVEDAIRSLLLEKSNLKIEIPDEKTEKKADMNSKSEPPKDKEAVKETK